MYWHLDPNLVVTHGAQIASSTHYEPEQVGRREVLGPWWVYREVPVCVCERPRPLHVDMLRYLPSTGVRSSATAHEEEDPEQGHAPFTKAGALATHYGGVEAVELLTVLLAVDRASTE